MSRSSKLIKRELLDGPFIFNLALWVLAYGILIFIFTKGEIPIKIDFIYTLGFTLTLMFPVVLNMYVLVPNYLVQEKFFKYFFFFIINIVFFVLINYWVLLPILDLIFIDYFFISYVSKFSIIAIFFIFLILTTLIKLSKNWYYFNKTENQLLLKHNEHIKMQLSSLRSQINPHFLFNSLNVIYALAIEKKDETKDAILQLSDILRYLIYDTRNEKISLKDEISLLKNYIAFFKFRASNSENIEFYVSIDDENYSIYPMLLLPLIENSYKHSRTDDITNEFIKIQLIQKDKLLSFSIKNNIAKNAEKTNSEYSGVGLENIRLNLDLVYPKKHLLTVMETKEIFEVKLTLEI
ncbi:MAG: sensor histidine kinase [Cellulophaga sp.]|nr:sensor histidine kinase [Cellulophaga sp.]